MSDSFFYKDIVKLGMPLRLWKYQSCIAEVATGEDWATVYFIQSGDQGKGHCTKLLTYLKEFYEKQGLRFGGTVALNDRMKAIYKRLAIKEYDQ